MTRATPRTNVSPADSFKVLIIASLRYPIAEPFAGGLEAHTFSLARGLQARGHSVLVAGAAGSDPSVVGYEFGRLPTGDPSERPDITNHPIVQTAEHDAFAALMEQLRDGMLGAFDVIHNNALHPFPVEHAGTLPCPLITTLHTPVLPWAERVLNARTHSDHDFVAVSRATARLWHPLIRPGQHRGVQGGDQRAGQGVGVLDRERVQGIVVDDVEGAEHAVPQLVHQRGERVVLRGLHDRMIGDVRAFAGIAGRQLPEFVSDHRRVAPCRAGHDHGVATRLQPPGERKRMRLKTSGEWLGDRVAQRGDDQHLEAVRRAHVTARGGTRHFSRPRFWDRQGSVRQVGQYSAGNAVFGRSGLIGRRSSG